MANTQLIADAENRLAFLKGQALTRLLANKDFELLITKGYCEQYVLDTVYAFSETKEDQDTVMLNRIKAVSYFKQFLDSIHFASDHAELAIAEQSN